jgi:hypothetical protein
MPLICLPRKTQKPKPKTLACKNHAKAEATSLLQARLGPFSRALIGSQESRCPSPITGPLEWNRQGLWIADLRTPPGQECSNGSMLFVAVVL